MRRFLVDTDTASDDAVALLMALRHPDIIVEAITVVAGNVGLQQAVQNALYATEVCGADAPVHAGARAPLLRDLQMAQDVHGVDGMGDAGLPLAGRVPAVGRAPQIIVDKILSAPGEITLVALGPLTNVAIAVLLAPEIASAVERLVVMGGTGVGGPGNVSVMAEYNFWADPEAAAIVTRAGFPIEFVGWDISIASAVVDTQRHQQLQELDTDLSRFALKISQVVRRFALERGLAGDDLPDPIAMAHAINPSVATMRRLAVDIMVGDGPQRGVMEVDQLGFGDIKPNVNIVTHYPSEDFFSLLFSTLRS